MWNYLKALKHTPNHPEDQGVAVYKISHSVPARRQARRNDILGILQQPEGRESLRRNLSLKFLYATP
jgi:hypothetical protein